MGEHRILGVEDQEDLAELYEATLRKSGYQVTVAFTGEEGPAKFSNVQFARLCDERRKKAHVRAHWIKASSQSNND